MSRKFQLMRLLLVCTHFLSASKLRQTRGAGMRLFWPRTGIKAGNGDLVGWRLGDTIVAVTVLDPASTSVIARFNATTKTLGRHMDLQTVAKVLTASDKGEALSAQFTVWTVQSGEPIASSEPVELVFYDPPDPTRLRFLTLHNTRHSAVKADCDSGSTRQDEYSVGTHHLDVEDGLEHVIPLLNAVRDVQRRLHSSQGNIPPTAAPLPGTAPEKRLARGILVTGISNLVHRCISASQGFSFRDVDISPREHSATVSQICLRLEQLASAPGIWRKAGRRAGVALPERSQHYMLFWNTAWLVLNDLILGYCARQFLLQMASVVAPYIKEGFSTYMIRCMIEALQWLNDWPVGLKLNTPLSQFFCTTLGIIVQTWSDIVVPSLDRAIPILLFGLELASHGGLTLLLATLNDLLKVFTLHLQLCSAITMVISKWQLGSLSGLWNLFRGKRWNVLRQRTDSYAYEIDQLFLGTLLFTVSIFLLPTVLTYAALFALTRLAGVVAERTIKLAITALNAFPLFELMLRLKEPSRLPAGIIFSIKISKPQTIEIRGSHAIATALELKNAPKSVMSVFRSP